MLEDDLGPRPLAERGIAGALPRATPGIRYNDHCDATGADVYPDAFDGLV